MWTKAERNKYDRLYYRANRKKIQRKLYKWRKNNQAKFNKWKHDYYVKNRTSINRKRQLAKYELSEQAYELLYLSQDGRCAICRRIRKFVIDHNHNSKRVRGLLCRNCNLGLGHFKDSKTLVGLALAYLREN